MKATGIVRRIDDLGRIVIPKEIRRTMRIREGDPLEIYTSPDGEVIFKKYSPVGEISNTASQYADVLSKVGGCPAVICDRDHVIAVSGMSKKEIIERRVSGSLEDLIEQRKSYVLKSGEEKRLNPIEGVDRFAIACSPILASGDVNGAVIMLSDGANDTATAEQSALVQAAAMYFGKQMEE
ncbi:MAG: AbrB/MazE/SpoVT family DNA-binding domain-containing protein [Oscillospiraceae bacterium]|nr:AbrB/MazE/SpoVT family DNA-binding domain-containing protein [Oscillospiraceae bacterium]